MADKKFRSFAGTLYPDSESYVYVTGISSTGTNSASSNTFLSNINTKVATEATLKTLATESTVSSIKSILAGFKSNLDTITTKVSDLADVLASPEDKQLQLRSA